MLKKPQNLGLFNDTTMLSHTRGSQLLNIFKLLWLLHESNSSSLSQQSLAQKGQETGIKEFKKFCPEKPIPTRIRHYWYALEKLNLVDKQRHKKSFYTLSQPGEDIAAHLQDVSIQKLTDIPDLALKKMAEVIRSNKYVNDIWLSFAINDQKTGFILENVSSNSIYNLRYNLSIYGEHPEKWKDSGYRIYSAENSSDWEKKCLFYPQQDKHKVTGCILSDTARKEIIQGIREWCHQLDITSEVPFPSLKPKAHINNRVRICMVLQELPNESISMKELQDFIEETIRQHDNGIRIRIPTLIGILCSRFNISLSNAKKILTEIQKYHSNRFYFEGASRGVVGTKTMKARRNAFDYYLHIGGIWRTTVRLLS